MSINHVLCLIFRHEIIICSKYSLVYIRYICIHWKITKIPYNHILLNKMNTYGWNSQIINSWYGLYLFTIFCIDVHLESLLHILIKYLFSALLINIQFSNNVFFFSVFTSSIKNYPKNFNEYNRKKLQLQSFKYVFACHMYLLVLYVVYFMHIWTDIKLELNPIY